LSRIARGGRPRAISPTPTTEHGDRRRLRGGFRRQLNDCASSAIDGRMRKKKADADKRRGRPSGPRPRPDDLDILLQVHVWMTWPLIRNAIVR
jgi:hypothetical protein